VRSEFSEPDGVTTLLEANQTQPLNGTSRFGSLIPEQVENEDAASENENAANNLQPVMEEELKEQLPEEERKDFSHSVEQNPMLSNIIEESKVIQSNLEEMPNSDSSPDPIHSALAHQTHERATSQVKFSLRPSSNASHINHASENPDAENSKKYHPLEQNKAQEENKDSISQLFTPKTREFVKKFEEEEEKGKTDNARYRYNTINQVTLDGGNKTND